MNPPDYNSVPKGQLLNNNFLTHATPRKGILNMTQVDTTRIDKAIARCQRITSLNNVKAINKRTTANESGCGWVTRGQGTQGQGVFGNLTRTFGPVPPDAVHYYPPAVVNSKNADQFKIQCDSDGCIGSEGFASIEETTEVPLCNKYKRCEDMKYFNSIMDSELCGYCPPSGRFVPMNKGVPKYKSAGCKTALITDHTKCPMSPNSANIKEAFTTLASLDACSAPLTRDCIVLAAKTAGCSPEGTLIASLYSAQQTSGFDANLQGEASYQIYQKQMAPLTALSNQSATIETALGQFKSLYNATTSENSNLSAASRDLCLQRSLDGYTFCNDVTDTTIVNDTNIVCLQQKYIKEGGKETDSSYPVIATCIGKMFSEC
jgi:hypothetical protein